MPESRSASLALVVLCAVVLPALAGLIVGGIAAPEPKVPQVHLVGGSSVSVQAPVSWRRVGHAPTIPGLVLKGGVALAPGGDPAQAGLVAGQVSAGGRGPLPASLLSRVRTDLRTEVVGVGSWDGYRYDNLRVAGFGPRLVLYAVPTAQGSTAVACYAASRAASYLSACDGIARSLEIIAGPDSNLPEVNRSYARSVGQVLDRLDRSRVAERGALRAGATPGRAAAATQRLAGAYGDAARSLSLASPPDAAGGAHATLLKSLWSSRDAYRRLTAAAQGKNPGAWSAARAAVDRAESGVSGSLGDLGALGYGRRA